MANGVTDSKEKKAVLITNFPTGTYELTKDLVAPILLGEDSLTYDTIALSVSKSNWSPEICSSRQVWVWQPSAWGSRNGESVCCCSKASSYGLVSGVRDKRMMLELWKLKLDIAVANTSLWSNLTRMLKLSRGLKSQSQWICYPSQGHARSLNLRKNLSLQRKRVSHPLKLRVLKVPTTVLEIMIIKVVLSKRKNVTTVTRPAIL